MKFTLPALPYSYDALEPYIDAKTMEIHYTKHHQGYVDKLNAAIEKHPELGERTLEDLLANLNEIPEDIRTAIRNQGGGHANHSFFWPIMAPAGGNVGGEPDGKIGEAIAAAFGSFADFNNQFSTAAGGVFGSGWAWLVRDKSDRLRVTTTANQDSPLLAGEAPILGIDVWEHAYYLKYQNKRPDYISAWWNVINWAEVEKNL